MTSNLYREVAQRQCELLEANGTFGEKLGAAGGFVKDHAYGATIGKVANFREDPLTAALTMAGWYKSYASGRDRAYDERAKQLEERKAAREAEKARQEAEAQERRTLQERLRLQQLARKTNETATPPSIDDEINRLIGEEEKHRRELRDKVVRGSIIVGGTFAGNYVRRRSDRKFTRLQRPAINKPRLAKPVDESYLLESNDPGDKSVLSTIGGAALDTGKTFLGQGIGIAAQAGLNKAIDYGTYKLTKMKFEHQDKVAAKQRAAQAKQEQERLKLAQETLLKQKQLERKQQGEMSKLQV